MWTQGNGVKIAYEDMTLNHLTNAVTIMQSNLSIKEVIPFDKETLILRLKALKKESVLRHEIEVELDNYYQFWLWK